MAVLISGVEVWRGFVHNLEGLRLTPRKQGSFQSVARSVVKTTGSLPSCQQAQNRVLDGSAGLHGRIRQR